MTKNAIEIVFSLESTRLTRLVTIKQSVIKYYVDNNCDEINSLTLTFDHMTWKLIGNIYSVKTAAVQNLLTIMTEALYIDFADIILSKTRILT